MHTWPIFDKILCSEASAWRYEASKCSSEAGQLMAGSGFFSVLRRARECRGRSYEAARG